MARALSSLAGLGGWVASVPSAEALGYCQQNSDPSTEALGYYQQSDDTSS